MRQRKLYTIPLVAETKMEGEKSVACAKVGDFKYREERRSFSDSKKIVVKNDFVGSVASIGILELSDLLVI